MAERQIVSERVHEGGHFCFFFFFFFSGVSFPYIDLRGCNLCAEGLFRILSSKHAIHDKCCVHRSSVILL